MRNAQTISRARRLVLATVGVLAAGALVAAAAMPPAAIAKDKRKPSIKKEAEGQFQRAKFKLVTHQIYENYYQATQSLERKDYKLTEAFLEVLAFYVDKMDDHFPGVDYEGNPIDEKEFLATVVKLKKDVETMQKQIQARKLTAMADPEEKLASACLLCHDTVVFKSKVRPTP